MMTKKAWIALWAAVGGTALAVSSLTRLHRLRTCPAANPARDYATAMAQAAQLQHQDDDAVVGPCRTSVLTHGRRVDRAIVLLHGFTNCPAQFVDLARALHADGYNVIVPRYPHHGLARLSPDLARLRAEELVATAAQAIDIAHGLGEVVTVMGLSLGGSLALWAALNRPDVHHVVAVSPALGVQAIPAPRRKLYGNMLMMWPNFFKWWDEETQDQVIGPAHAYPRFASHALAQLLRLGQIVLDEAAHRQPAVRSLLVVMNPHDEVVDNHVIRQMVSGWRACGATVPVYEFDADLELIHDLIDPAQTLEKVEAVYPILQTLLARQRAADLGPLAQA